jgi:hypothetical protein
MRVLFGFDAQRMGSQRRLQTTTVAFCRDTMANASRRGRQSRRYLGGP